jgi:hypothetical protein
VRPATPRRSIGRPHRPLSASCGAAVTCCSICLTHRKPGSRA